MNLILNAFPSSLVWGWISYRVRFLFVVRVSLRSVYHISFHFELISSLNSCARWSPYHRLGHAGYRGLSNPIAYQIKPHGISNPIIHLQISISLSCLCTLGSRHFVNAFHVDEFDVIQAWIMYDKNTYVQMCCGWVGWQSCRMKYCCGFVIGCVCPWSRQSRCSPAGSRSVCSTVTVTTDSLPQWSSALACTLIPPLQGRHPPAHVKTHLHMWCTRTHACTHAHTYIQHCKYTSTHWHLYTANVHRLTHIDVHT